MINPVSTQIVPQALLRPTATDDVARAAPATAPGVEGAGSSDGARKTSFSDLVSGLVRDVDAKGKAADTEVRRLMLGETDNIHQSMIAMQESGLAFNLLVEVRNKLVDSYQELMRMAV